LSPIRMLITIDYFELIFVKSCECVRKCVSQEAQVGQHRSQPIYRLRTPITVVPQCAPQTVDASHPRKGRELVSLFLIT
jgi:hypothetical protein